MRFLMGAAAMAVVWASVEWWKNPMGVRGGEWTAEVRRQDGNKVTAWGVGEPFSPQFPRSR